MQTVVLRICELFVSISCPLNLVHNTNTRCRQMEYASSLSRSFSPPAKGGVNYIFSFWIASPNVYTYSSYNIYIYATVGGTSMRINTSGSTGTPVGALPIPFQYNHLSIPVKAPGDFDNIKIYLFSIGSSQTWIFDDFALYEDDGLPVCAYQPPTPDPAPSDVCYKNFVQNPGFETGDASPWGFGSPGSVQQKDTEIGPGKFKAHSGDWLL